VNLWYSKLRLYPLYWALQPLLAAIMELGLCGWLGALQHVIVFTFRTGRRCNTVNTTSMYWSDFGRPMLQPTGLRGPDKIMSINSTAAAELNVCQWLAACRRYWRVHDVLRYSECQATHRYWPTDRPRTSIQSIDTSFSSPFVYCRAASPCGMSIGLQRLGDETYDAY